MSDGALSLENQLCFPFYAISRLITRSYQPLLDPIGITYPQYLVLLVLWEYGESPVGGITARLHLNTNTITPVLKRLEQSGFIVRGRKSEDERVVRVSLTPKGRALKRRAASIPMKLLNDIDYPVNELQKLQSGLTRLLAHLSSRHNGGSST